MTQIFRLFGMAVAALSLASCATVEKLDAANDVHALLLSIRDGDQAAFEAYVDRPALQREIEARLTGQVGHNPNARALAALLGPAAAQIAGDVLVQPSVFRLVAERYGYRREARIPPPVAIAQLLQPQADGRICATRGKGGPCLLMFSKLGENWKLSGFEGDLKELKL